MADDEKLPIGFPCRNTDILILDDQNRAVQGDEPGELCVRGSSLALGYWNNPELTARAFAQNPLNPHYSELIYRTGDLVHRNARGEIMFIGRKDFQVKHLGYRIELGEIEHAALRVDGVRNACVVYHCRRSKSLSFSNLLRIWLRSPARAPWRVLAEIYAADDSSPHGAVTEESKRQD